MTIRFSKQEFLEVGTILGSSWSNEQIDRMTEKRKKQFFKNSFFASAKTVKEMFRDMQHPNMGDNRIENPNPVDFLAACYFLKKYPTKLDQAKFLGCSERYGLEKAWRYVYAIKGLKEKKIRWIFEEEPYISDDDYYLATVDGVHFCIYEPRFMPSTGWYSCKYNKAGLAYEIACSVYHDKIVWVNGPFPAGQNDMRIFKKPNGLLSKIPDGKKVIGDEGYVGEEKAATRNEFDTAEVKELKNRAKARQESVNQKLKSFEILRNPFCTTGQLRLERHQAAVEACLVIIQYELDNGSRKLMKT